MEKLAISVGRMMGRMRADESSDKYALIIPPTVPGSLGDSAMISASSGMLRDRGLSRVDLMSGKAWNLDEKIDRQIKSERYFYKRSQIQHAWLVSHLPRYSEFYMIGADVIDGSYNLKSITGRLGLFSEAAKLGKKATLLGSSFSKKAQEPTTKILRELPDHVTVCARDPNSKKRMEDVLNRPIRQVADLAFLVESRPQSIAARDAINWINTRKKAGDQVIGLNANFLHVERDKNLPAALQILVEKLLLEDLSIILVPHDTRSAKPDEAVLADAVSKISDKDRERVRMLSPESPGTVRAVLEAVDLLVTGRMHATILALGTGTPAFNFAYQDKFEGLLQLFNLEDANLLSSPEELSQQPEAVAEKIIAVLKGRDQLAQHIQHYLPSVIDLARRNFL
jgi:polysaccharide pyruvyl transferase WcaK-like protein